MKLQKENCNMVLKTMQLLHNREKARVEGRCVHITEQPLQLGVASTREWRASDDICKNAPTNGSLIGLLRSGCDCGHFALKQRASASGLVHTSQKNPAELCGQLVHQTKDYVMQRFCGGSMIFKGQCTVTRDGDRKNKSKEDISYLTFPQDVGRKGENVRLRLVFLYPLHDQTMSLQRDAQQEQEGTGGDVNTMARTIGWMQEGAVVMASHWEGMGRKILEVHGCTENLTNCIALVGDYVGPEHHSTRIFLKDKNVMHTKPTVLDLFGLHFPENRCPRGYLANPYGDLH